jgi:hypothetical protein
MAPKGSINQLLIDYLGPFLALMTFVILGGGIYYTYRVSKAEIATIREQDRENFRLKGLEKKRAEMTKKGGGAEGKQA